MRIVLFFVVLFSLTYAQNILVSIAPQKYFVQQIVGEDEEVYILIPPGSSPANYVLRPKDLRAIKNASIYFTIGVPFESAWIERIKSLNPKLLIVDMGEYVKHSPMKNHHLKHQKHLEEHEEIIGYDPHIWLSPPLAPLLARRVLNSLIDRNPKKYLHNYEHFLQKVAHIDRVIYEKLLPYKGRAFIVYHPSFGYFAKSYSLVQIAIEEEGKEPKISQLLHIIKKASKEHVKAIFIEPQFPKRSAQLLARKLGVKIITIDPLEPNWEENIQRIANAIASSYRD